MIVFYLYVAYILEVNAYKYLHDTPFSYGYNGVNALHRYGASLQELPYHVLIAYLNLYCSGSLIRSKVVVTVASCFFKWRDQRIVVKVGAESVTGIGQVIEVIELKKHEYFTHEGNLDNDIALLMLKDHVIFSKNVQKIIIVEPEMALLDGTTLYVSGWGSATLQPAKYANSLLWSEMSLLEAEECLKYYPYLMTRSNFCVKYSPERRISDNGGPAVFRELLVGILSFGAANTEEPYVAVLTNVSYFHRWITLNTKRFMNKYCSVISDYYIDNDLNSETNNDVW